jgi:cell division protein FtsL
VTAVSLALRSPRRRLVWTMIVVTIIGVVFIGVYPTRTYLAQRSSLQRTQHQLEVLQAENAKLDQEAADLQSDSKIEALAREKFNLVRPGEESIAILPAPTASVVVPSVWPFTGLAAKVNPPPSG